MGVGRRFLRSRGVSVDGVEEGMRGGRDALALTWIFFPRSSYATTALMTSEMLHTSSVRLNTIFCGVRRQCEKIRTSIPRFQKV
jgi:hypothetical protein